MQTDPPVPAPKRRKRHWFQFSLRSLMIFSLVCAVGSAWVARKIEQKRNEREAVNAITKLGGEAYWDYQRVPAKVGRAWQPDGAQPKGPTWLRKLLGENFFSEAECVCAVGGLEHLKELPRLPELRLIGGGVTDAGLVYLKGLSELKNVGLVDTNVTGVGVRDHLKALPNCKVFEIHQNVPRPVMKSSAANPQQPKSDNRPPSLR